MFKMSSLFNDKLNDDAVFHIFSFLTPKNLLKSAQVCKRWQCLTNTYWPEIRVLDIDEMVQESSSEEVNDNITKIFQKCTGVKRIVARNCQKVTKIYSAVSEHCSKLNTIILCETLCVTRDILHLAVTCKQLKKIDMNTPFVRDNALSKLFNRNPNLESVALRYCAQMDGSCFKYLPPSIKEICLQDNRYLDVQQFLSNISKLKQLESLSFKDYIGRFYCRRNFLNLIANVAGNLKHLTITSEELSLEPIIQFKHLTSLNLYGNVNADDKILRTICDSCRELEVISLGFKPDECIVNVKKISVEGLSNLSKLSKLREINLYRLIINLPWVSLISRQLDLKVIRIVNCRSFNDNSANEFIKNCTNLTHLHMSCNNSISQEIIFTAARDLDLQPERTYRLRLTFDNEELLKGVDNTKPFHPLLDVFIFFPPRQ